jgi:microcystin-dependent protein
VPSNLTTIPDGMYLTVISVSANTAPASLNLTLGSTTLGSYPIVKGDNVALASGDIPGAGYPIQLNWSATYSAYIMSNPATGILVTTVPTGSIMWFPATSAPSGYLIAEGQLISRSTYASLWTFAQASGNIVSDTTWNGGQYGSFSTGDGSTTFRLPQLGGYFIRNLDNGNGIDPSRAIGTVQQNQNQTHTHTATSISSVTDPGHSHLSNAVGLVNANINWVGTGGLDYRNANDTQTAIATTGIAVSTSTTLANAGGTESRPVNIPLLCCIKY